MENAFHADKKRQIPMFSAEEVSFFQRKPFFHANESYYGMNKDLNQVRDGGLPPPSFASPLLHTPVLS